jgi:hypothetical protein
MPRLFWRRAPRGELIGPGYRAFRARGNLSDWSILPEVLKALTQFAGAVRSASRPRRAALAALHVLLGTAIVVALGSLLLWLLQRRLIGSETAAGRIRIAEFGVATVAMIAFFLLWFWAHPILALTGLGKRHSFLVAAVIVSALTGLLSTRETPNAAALEAARLLRVFDRAPAFDVLLVLDPSDPGARRLVRAARERPAALTQRPRGADWDVRLGVAVVRPARPMHPVWSIGQPVTADREAVVRALAGLSIQGKVPSAAGSYPHAVYEAVRPGISSLRIGWRLDAERSIVLVADRLPTKMELDSTFQRYLALLDAGKLDVPPYLRKVARNPEFGLLPVPWENALRRLSLQLSIPGVSPGYSLSVVTRATTSPQLAAWREWTTRGRGDVLLPGRFTGVRSALDVAELAAIGYPTSRLQSLAERYRPLLFFDSNELFRVLDVREFLRERDADGTPRHQVCERHALNDECRPLRSAHDLRSTDDHLDVGDEPTDERPIENSGVIYYEALPDGERVHLVYWWFFRYNESPVWSAYNCRAGLAIAERTCFDHEGDWEGVTVTLALQKRELGPESVTYYGHAWPGYRFTWPRLKAIGSTSGGHAHVYVAFGSHASYPAKCTRRGLKCKQLDFEKYGQVLPDGRHNGEVHWYGNRRCDGCLEPLPVDRRGIAVSWNHFPGVWGASECTRIAKVCLKSDGPRSPSKQDRTGIPLPGIDGSANVLSRHGP